MQIRDPLVFGSWEGLVFWAVFVWAFAPELLITHRGAARSKSQANSQDAGTVRLIMISNSIGIFGAFVLAWLPWTMVPHPRVALYAGTSLIVAGSVLRRWCWRALGKYFTGNIVVTPGQPVVDSGPYWLVRHPSYTAGIAMAAGIGVALGNWASIALLVIEPCLLYGYRARVEERALIATLGEPYRTCMARTKRFIPFVV
jgi:protein-S-isoprenylcysteine O-methyltransferase Ste14